MYCNVYNIICFLLKYVGLLQCFLNDLVKIASKECTVSIHHDEDTYDVGFNSFVTSGASLNAIIDTTEVYLVISHVYLFIDALSQGIQHICYTWSC